MKAIYVKFYKSFDNVITSAALIRYDSRKSEHINIYTDVSDGYVGGVSKVLSMLPKHERNFTIMVDSVEAYKELCVNRVSMALGAKMSIVGALASYLGQSSSRSVIVELVPEERDVEHYEVSKGRLFGREEKMYMNSLVLI